MFPNGTEENMHFKLKDIATTEAIPIFVFFHQVSPLIDMISLL